MLPNLTSLTYLHCYPWHVSDPGIVDLGAFSSLTRLELGDCFQKITDTGVRSISVLTSVEILCLTGCHITDGGMRTVGKWTSLTSMGLRRRCGITDLGVQCLASLVSLTHLDLCCCEGVKAAVVSSLWTFRLLMTFEVVSFSSNKFD